MFHHRALRTMIAATALVGLVALGGPTVASVDSKAAAAPSQRGPNNENYDPPMYTPTSRPVYDGTPANPLVREWGVYQGLAEMSWMPYLTAGAEQQALLDKIVQRPKATWFGHWQPDGDITDRVRKYIELTTGGDPDVLVQTSIFRMDPWELEACKRLPTAAEQASYKTWIDGFVAGVGDAHMAVIMQPDGPFVLCAPGDSKVPAKLIKYGVRKLSALPNTSVYIDAGAADWNREDPKKALQMLIPMGIRWARGFALNSTHYDSTERQVRYSAAIAKALVRTRDPGQVRRHQHLVERPALQGLQVPGPELRPRRRLQVAAGQALRDPRHPAHGRRGRPEVGPQRERPPARREVRRRLPVVRPSLALQPGRPVPARPGAGAGPHHALLTDTT